MLNLNQITRQHRYILVEAIPLLKIASFANEKVNIPSELTFERTFIGTNDKDKTKSFRNLTQKLQCTKCNFRIYLSQYS